MPEGDNVAPVLSGPALSEELGTALLRRSEDPDLDSSTAELLVGDIFRFSGARVFGESSQLLPAERKVDRPDLAIWQDDLLATFGQPLLVEVLIRPISTKALIPRLRRTLFLSGARSLLAVTIHKHHDPQRWADEHGLVFTAALPGLIGALRSHSLVESLVLLRDAALSGPLG
jgi:hypothetical protein